MAEEEAEAAEGTGEACMDAEEADEKEDTVPEAGDAGAATKWDTAGGARCGGKWCCVEVVIVVVVVWACVE